MIQYTVMYGYKIFRLFIIAIIITYFSGCFWYMFSAQLINSYPRNFIKHYDLLNKSNVSKLTISSYYALTTLSTVGYGDFVPQNNPEIVLTVALMLCGVAFFSYIIGQFIEIISNYQTKMGKIDKSTQLLNWITLMRKFTSNKPLSKSHNTLIETHFAHYW
jgi:potassium voltage-gated channel Eag-related subfamily H protein 8